MFSKSDTKDHYTTGHQNITLDQIDWIPVITTVSLYLTVCTLILSRFNCLI